MASPTFNLTCTQRSRGRRMACRAHERGFTLLEVLIATVVLGVASLGALSITVSSLTLENVNRESAAATAATQHVLEQMHSVPFSQVFARFNGDPADDPGGPGTSMGSSFTMMTRGGSAMGSSIADAESTEVPLTVSVDFPVDATGALTEVPTGPKWQGMSWDLDGDGSLGAASASTTYRVLPVSITVSWTSPDGQTRDIQVTRLLNARSGAGVASEYGGSTP